MVKVNANGFHITPGMVIYVLARLAGKATEVEMSVHQKTAWGTCMLPYTVADADIMNTVAGIPIKVADIPDDEIRFFSGDTLVATISRLDVGQTMESVNG